MRLNILRTDIERTCFCCPAVTRLILITSLENVPMCLECLVIYAGLMSAAEKLEAAEQEMIDPGLVDRHINN